MASRPPRIVSSRRQPTTRAPLTPGQQSVRTLRAWYRNPRRNVGAKPKPPAPRAPVTPSAPAAPAAPQYSLSVLPPDASYDAMLASLQRQRDTQIAALTQARTGALLDYGFKEGPNGMLTFDPNNPLSKAAQLKKAYDTNRRSTGNQMAAGGQLYSGSYQNAQDLINRNQLGAEDQMQKSIARFLAQNTQAGTDARTGYETAAGQAYGDRVGRFQSNPLYDPATGALMPAAGAGGPSTGSVPLAGPIGGRSITVPPRQEKTVRGKRYYKGKSGRWIPV